MCLATAYLAGAQVQVILATEEIRSSKEFKNKNITGSLPCLEVEDSAATIFDTVAIIKYLAKVGPEGSTLLGASPVERA